MYFLNPPLLTGLAASLVPLVLHLLSRSRFQNVDWGAMMFLGGPDSEQRQSTRLKQWILLGLRMGTIGLLALALARPVLLAKSTPTSRTPRNAAVILFDRSASMALQDNGRARLDMAREAVFQILPGLHKGDDLWLIPMGEPLSTGVPYTTDPQDLSQWLKEISTGSGRADVAASLREAVRLLQTTGAAQGEIYIVCDHQADSWSGVNGSFAAEIHRLMDRLPLMPRVFVIPVGTDESDNVAIESVDFMRLPVVAEQTNLVDVKVRNYAGAPRAAIEVKVGPNSVPVNLPANGTATVRLPVTLNEIGQQLLITEVAAQGLTFDKRFDVVVDVLRDLRVLIIDGDEHEGAFRSESDFLKLALSPYHARRKDPAVVDVVSPEDAAAMNLDVYRVVILTNVPQLSEAQARALEQFVYDGGGLLVAPGDRSRADNYNDRLYRDGDGILPAELQPAIPESDATATAVGHIDLSHPIFTFLRNRPDAAPPGVVRRYFPVTPREYGTKVIASYSDGRPFLLESPAGRGRVLLMTTSVDIDWNSLALTHFFLPFAQSSVRYLAEDRSSRHNLSPGEPIIADIDGPFDPRAIVLRVPELDPRRGDGRPTFADPNSLSITQIGTRFHIRFENTQAAGIYRLFGRRTDGKPLAIFAVRAPASESDLTPLAPPRWKELEQQLGFSRIDADRRTIAAAQDVARSGVDLWLPLLAIVVVLSLAELVMARRWSGAVA